jgi:hypothetical protein
MKALAVKERTLGGQRPQTSSGQGRIAMKALAVKYIFLSNYIFVQGRGGAGRRDRVPARDGESDLSHVGQLYLLSGQPGRVRRRRTVPIGDIW